MAGHMGAARVTVQNLEIVATDGERGLIMVKGGLPGAKGGYVLVKDAVKRPAPEGLPFPAAIKTAPVAEAAPAEAPAEEAAPEATEE
jgi:large subunit ribosomal protein L3